MTSHFSPTKWTQREKFLLSGLLVASVLAAVLGLVLIRPYITPNVPPPASVASLPQKVTVTGNARQNSTISWQTIEIAFGGPCTQFGTNIPVSTACVIQSPLYRTTVSWLPLYGAGTGASNGDFTIVLPNNETYYMYLSYWGNYQQTQRENCIAGLGLYAPQATSLFLRSATVYYQMNSTISCAAAPETIYGMS